MGPCTRLWRAQTQGKRGAGRSWLNPGRYRRDLSQTIGVGVFRQGYRIDFDLPRRRRKLAAIRIPDFLGKGDRILGGREPGDTLFHERLKVIDGVSGQVLEPIQFLTIVIAFDSQAMGQFGEDVDVIPTLVHRLDRLAHEYRIVTGPCPRHMDVVAFPESRGWQDYIRVSGGRGEEVVLGNDKLDVLQRADHLVDVRALIEQIAARRIDHLDVGRKSAALAAGEQIGKQRRGNARIDGILAGRKAFHAGPSGCAVAGTGIAPGDTDVPGYGCQRISGAMKLLAMDRAARCIAGLHRSRLARPEFNCDAAKCHRIDSGYRGCPFRRLRNAIAEAEEIRLVRTAGSSTGGQMVLVKAQDIAVTVRLVVQPFSDNRIGHGNHRGRIGTGPYEDMLIGKLTAGHRPTWIDTDDAGTVLPRP